MNKYSIVYLDGCIGKEMKEVKFKDNSCIQEYNKHENHNTVLKEKMLGLQKSWDIQEKEKESMSAVKGIKKDLNGLNSLIGSDKKAVQVV